ncbi:hypothetical protein L486_03397 [Kwoniella mangroviensis CBS 10435]|uniref:Helicase ATP-binding domain-containing protein n=1 Tax=Kwoniella mangroviensis CBS 10435 TaxID=1331196 RepID=A0A1B9IU04_9TREE|nr:hypothetical protein L486_03397 [Kwoniella mangroviensis CBS 10435]
MLCRVCLKAGQSLLDRPTSSKFGARVFSRYLSTVKRSSISHRLSQSNVAAPYETAKTGRNQKCSLPLQRYIHTETKNEYAISRWLELGISRPLAERLISSYPHIIQPTPAQKLFLLAVGAGKEIYLKDDMGRGKTLALALSAMNIALRSDSNTTQNGLKVMILLPTPHLAQQVHQHLVNLSTTETQKSFTLIRFNSNHPSHSFAQTSTKSHSKLELPNKPIIISTPKDLQYYDLSPKSIPFLRYIFIDEPEHLIGPIPSRHSTSQMLISHPLFRHPPPIVSALNDLLNILPALPSRRQKEEGGILDYSERRDEINTIWVSSGMNKDLKRFIKMRGWIRKSNRHVKDGLIDLDFTQGASGKLKDVRNRLLGAVEERITKRSTTQIKENQNQNVAGIEDEGGVKKANIDGHEQIEPEHHVLVIDPKDGSINSLDLHAPTLQDDPTKEVEDDNGEDEVIRKREIPIEMIETLSLIHATTSSPSKGYSLILPPEGISLNILSEELANLGISSLILTPDLVNISLSQLDELQRQNRDEAEEENGELPLLLGTRSSIPGLHLPELQTIYLLDGLDVKGLSKKQRKSGGVKDRYGWYNLVKGRLGRLGSKAIGRERQRVVSLVMGGTEEEMRLRELFGKNENVNGIKLQLKDWDMKGLEDALSEMMRVEDSTAGLEMEQDVESQDMMKLGQDIHGPKEQEIFREEAFQADVRKE